jgi:hypothetical protein
VHGTRLAAVAGQEYSQSGKPRIAWDDPAARDELVTALVSDALVLLGELDVEAIEKPAASRPRQSRCWHWSQGRTWNRLRAPTAPTAGGGSPVRPHRTG